MLRTPVIAVFAATLLVVACADGERANMTRRIDVIAHRGAHENVPENTMPAIRRAIDLGVDYIEVDVRMTRDGAFVNFHDGTVDRKTDGTGPVSDLTLAELQALDAGSHVGPEFAGERIPTVDETFAAMASAGIPAYVDVKDAPPDSVVALLRRHDLLATSVVYGSPSELAAMKAIDPAVRGEPEYPGTPEALAELLDQVTPYVIAISRFSRITSEAVAACQATGALVQVDVMGNDTPEGWQFVVDCGVDGIQTDRPEALIAWLSERGLR